MIGAMILAAGRGERMRPLTEHTPKPMLAVGGKPLIVWQIEALARAGFETIVINAAHLASRMTDALGDGRSLGVALRWSLEAEPLETAGGIANAMPLLPPGPALIVSGDVWTAFDYRSLRARAARMAEDARMARVHLVMVANPPYNASGDFVLEPADRHRDIARALRLPGLDDRANALTYANIGLYDTALFRALPRGTKLRLLPFFRQWIEAGIVTGERFDGPWANVGTPDELRELDRTLLGATRNPRTE